MRLIDADALIEYIKKRVRNEMVIAWLCRIIGEVLTIEAEPVRHGYWIEGRDGSCMCSECGKVSRYEIGYYCSKCGAKMDLPN